MSKRILLAMKMGMMAAAGISAGSISAVAADLPVPAYERAAASCGRCGCLQVTYEHHRELKATYGADFDPRSYDQTVPHYYFGPVRAYPRYYVAGGPVE